MANLQYIGARYVPKFFLNPDDQSNDWKSGVQYEALTIVTYNNDSYTSKKVVPTTIGNPASNPEYWACTTRYTAALQALQTTVGNIENFVGDLPLATQAQTLSGAVNELDGVIKREVGKAIFYFPNLESADYSASSALVTVGDKTIIFDCSSEECRSEVISFYANLYARGLFRNVDYIIISHYHRDHIELLDDILRDFPHAGCQAYLPLSPEGFIDQPSLLDNRTFVINTLEAYNVPYVEVNSEITIDVVEGYFSIELLNSTAAAYSHYSDLGTNYNDYSMVSLVKVGAIYAMFPGDLSYAGQTYLIANRSLPRLFLYAVHHHGIQGDDNLAYMNMISPEWGVISTSHSRLTAGSDSSVMANYAIRHIQSTAYSSQIFVMDGRSGYIVDGVQMDSNGSSLSKIYLYVDNSYIGDVHDGTPEHPFTNINEAVYFIRDNKNLKYYICLKPTDTAYENFHFGYIAASDVDVSTWDYTDTKAKIHGVVMGMVRSARFSNIEFDGVYTYDGIDVCAYVADSNVIFASCDFIVDDDTAGYGAILGRHSVIYLSSCSFNNFSSVFRTSQYCDYITNGLTFLNVTTCYLLVSAHFVIEGLDTVSNITNYLYSSDTNGAREFDLQIASSDIAAFETLMQYNHDAVISNMFKSGQHRYQIQGKHLFKDVVTDLNDAVCNGVVTFASSATNAPTSIVNSGGVLQVIRRDETHVTQIASFNSTGNLTLAIRKLDAGGWTAWSSIVPT